MKPPRVSTEILTEVMAVLCEACGLYTYRCPPPGTVEPSELNTH